MLGIVLSLSMVVLAITLLRSCGQGKAVVEAYFRSVRAGAAVTSNVGGREAETLTALLRGAHHLSVQNFQAQHGTACFFTTLDGETGKSEVRFVLGDEERRVIAASARRNCDCPIDADLPCHLVD